MDEAIEFTLIREGGWYDGSEARDPNPTMYGVTQKTYDGYRNRKGLPLQSVRGVSKAEVREIYAGYWHSAGCDLVARLSAITLFDHSINAGPAAALKVLQRAVGVDDDGVIGPKTRNAIATARCSSDAELASDICWERVRFYVDLAKNTRLRPNLLSWVHRVVKFREEFLK